MQQTLATAVHIFSRTRSAIPAGLEDVDGASGG